VTKSKNPTTFADYFEVPAAALDRLGVLNPTLAIDTRLFIDPLLLATSKHPEMQDASQAFRGHFEKIIKLLSRSTSRGDVAWRNAARLFDFHEVPGTCLGYGSDGVHGSGFGRDLTDQLMDTARGVIALGVDDPDLFLAMALFEDGTGPDRISDLTTNVIIEPLLAFNRRVLSTVTVPTEPFQVLGRDTHLPRNPFPERRTPVLLLPTDILRRLPIAIDRSDIADAAYHNQILRDRVNEHVGAIWEIRTRKDKESLKQQALASRAAFQALLDALHAVPREAYDVHNDPAGLIKWAERGAAIAAEYPLDITTPAQLDIDAVHSIVREIIRRFRQLIENNGLADALWYEGKPLRERYAQLLFFAVAYSYCKANNLDVSPEVDSGSGAVDFKFSSGFAQRVLVELKLSDHGKVVPGFAVQLEAYKQAEETMRAAYVVLDVGRMGGKRDLLIRLRNAAASQGDPVSDLEFIDVKPKPSASKR
jgi:hypothetical protein